MGKSLARKNCIKMCVAKCCSPMCLVPISRFDWQACEGSGGCGAKGQGPSGGRWNQNSVLS